MRIMTYTSFDGDDFRAFRDNDRPGPVHMLNLVRFRPVADYPDGRQVSGAEAYAAYGRGSGPIFARVGGRIVWRGALEQVVIGPRDEAWDLCFIAEYPSPGAFIEMLKDPDYRQAMAHRQAAVADSRLIRLAPVSGGEGFGG
jgi:uncharacterized protein (DUF1330 family)